MRADLLEALRVGSRLRFCTGLGAVTLEGVLSPSTGESFAISMMVMTMVLKLLLHEKSYSKMERKIKVK